MPPRSTRAAKAKAAAPATLMDAEDVVMNDASEGMPGETGAGDDNDDDASSILSDGSGDNYVAPEEDALPSAAEPQTDDVFNRLAGYVSSGVPTDGGVGASIQLEMAAIDEEELPQATKRPKRRPHKAHKPTYEVQQLLGRANMAYITQDHPEAIRLFLEVIRLDNQVQAAWTTLASVYEEQGDTVMARQMKFCSAHIEEDAAAWSELAEQFRTEGNTTQALYCLRKALKVDSSRVDILWQLVNIYRTNGQNKKAVEAVRKIHKAEPAYLRDFNLLMELQPVFQATEQWSLAANIFGDAFVFHFATFDGPEDAKADVEEQNTMELDNIVAYVEYLLKSGDPETAISVIHRGQRWLQGRKTEKAWDALEDDSEYIATTAKEDEEEEQKPDLDIQLRHKLAVARLRLGQHDEAMVHVHMILQLDAALHANIFKELGETLMKRQLWELALDCWDALHEQSPEDEPSVIYNIGVVQHQLKMLPEAVESLKWVIDMDKSNTQARLELASVLEDMGNKTEALEIVAEVIRQGGMPTTEGQPKSKRSAGHRLNKKVLEAQAAVTMNSLWQDVQKSEAELNNGNQWALEQFIQAAGTMIETFRLAKNNFSRTRGITRIIKRRKNMAKNDLNSMAVAMQDRLERTLGMEDEAPMDGKYDYEVRRQTEFYGIGYEDWLTLTIKYCCVLMVKGEEDVVMEILEHVVWAGLFNNRRSEIALRLTIIACGIRMKAYEQIAENCKRLAQMHQFRSEPLLLMLAAFGTGQKPQFAWHNVALQKFLHRELRIYDEAVLGVKLRWNKTHQRWAQILQAGINRRVIEPEVADADDSTRMSRRDSLNEVNDADSDAAGDDGDGDVSMVGADADDIPIPKPQIQSPVFNTIYGQNMLTTKSYQSALFYFFRAYEVNPYDAYLCFLIAQAFLGRAMNRQSDNRNYQIAQALAFMARYRKLSPQDSQSQEQVEYNFGRAFHVLGVTHLAARHYERVLDSVRQRMDAAIDDEERQSIRQNSQAWEAAHNLVLVYTASGSVELVKLRAEEWLSLED